MSVMKRAGLLTFVVVLAALTFASAAPTGRNETARQQLIALTPKVLDAERTHDAALLDKLFAPDYAVMNSAGQVLNRAQALERVRSTAVNFSYMHSDIIDVRIYGNVGIVIERTRVKGVAHGKPFDRLLRFVRVWVKQRGAWHIAYVQGTPLKPEVNSSS
ncbi:MAG: nuclear transport factor 2 family protein [Terriglobia bacterium]